MSLDPILSLAVTVQSNPGAYALLLGSGTSRAGQIPTGWEVTLDLVRRVAAAAGADAGADPAKWYTDRFGIAPRYSDLLKDVARSQTERAQLLRGHFEPTDDEREQGLKVPTEVGEPVRSSKQPMVNLSCSPCLPSIDQGCEIVDRNRAFDNRGRLQTNLGIDRLRSW